MMIGGLNIIPDAFCPTWEPTPLTGWRRLLNRYLHIPFKTERRRILFTTATAYTVIVSPETYAWLEKQTTSPLPLDNPPPPPLL